MAASASLKRLLRSRLEFGQFHDDNGSAGPVSFFRNQPIVVITLRVMSLVKHHAERDDYFLLSQPPSAGGPFYDGKASAGAVAAASSRSTRGAIGWTPMPPKQLRIGQIQAAAAQP
jgi:hypothetical protein